jgi:2-C-methyl-D-erythritol 2,4-cyclodiphosphate synthase
MRIGIGFDVHRFVKGRDLLLGGVKIPHEEGLEGHSDADVLIHAIIDALLGALSLGDIGKHFPPSDQRYKGISSLKLLEKVSLIIEGEGYKVGNIDSVVIAEEPKISTYTEEMRGAIASALGIESSRVSVKGTTSERLGFTGRGEGIAAKAVALLDMQKES